MLPATTTNDVPNRAFPDAKSAAYFRLPNSSRSKGPDLSYLRLGERGRPVTLALGGTDDGSWPSDVLPGPPVRNQLHERVADAEGLGNVVMRLACRHALPDLDHLRLDEFGVPTSLPSRGSPVCRPIGGVLRCRAVVEVFQTVVRLVSVAVAALLVGRARSDKYAQDDRVDAVGYLSAVATQAYPLVALAVRFPQSSPSVLPVRRPDSPVVPGKISRKVGYGPIGYARVESFLLPLLSLFAAGLSSGSNLFVACVLFRRAVGEVGQVVIASVCVGVSNLLPGRTRPHKGTHDKTVYEVTATGQLDLSVVVAVFRRVQLSPMTSHAARPYAAVATSHVPRLVRYVSVFNRRVKLRHGCSASSH